MSAALPTLQPLPLLPGARALAAALQRRELSCRELMQACLARIDRFNPQVNALVSLQPPDEMLRQADACDARLARGEPVGRLHGFPMAPKDFVATAGLPTTMGSPVFARQVTAHDAIMVERLRRAGALFVGRSNTPEFGLGSHTYNTVFGTTRNAWSPDHAAGGSSGGAAVALALHMLPVADGSDMMGSLRNPAAWNHVYGLRPSLGRVPTGPGPELFFQQLGCEGPMGRTPEDVAWLLSVQAGHDARSPLSLAGDGEAFAQPLDSELRGKRIAWLGDLGGHLPMDPGVMALCESALRHFDTLGCSVEPALPVFDFHALWNAWLGLRGFIVAGALRGLHADPATRALLKPEARWEIEQGERLSTTALHQAAVTRTQWHGVLLQLFERFDFLVLPAAQVFPLPVDVHWPREVGGRAMDTYHRWMEVTIGPSLAGLPAMAIPAGFSQADGTRGLPMGLQLIGRPGADLDVLRMAHGWHQAVPFANVQAPLLRQAH
ncbi:amidase [Variovorax sp. EL159]|uniref:amidase n=1 Tax=Variovorax sp. EL159 TaxID=1566270 RepID=UPI00087F9C52|nr:amidase [Variovorax sp. EL159]SCX73559.1 amidase [Variovorax sp. EL159]